MADGINLDGAGIDMFPGETSSVVTGIGEAGTRFREGWLGMLGAIAALDSQLGNGPLGRVFAADYIPSVRQIVEALDELGRRLEERVRFGHYAVNEYVTTDQNAAQGYQT